MNDGRRHERIELTDSIAQIVSKLAEDHPGALAVLTNAMQTAPQVDPQDIFQGMGVMLSLDTQAIYGEDIWTLYQVVCEEDIVRFLGMMRACQMGVLIDQDLKLAIRGRTMIDTKSIMRAIVHKLPSFKWSDDEEDGVTADLE